MAEVTSFTAAAIQAIADAGIADASIDQDGNLILTRNDNTEINAGSLTGGGTPSGTVVMFAGSVVPSGWLLCNGQLVSRTTYSALFTALGTAFGAGDGVNTFALPNMETKFPRMQAAAVGGTGLGSHSHTVPSHIHTVGAHAHAVNGHSHNLEGGSPTPGHARIIIVNVASPNLFDKRLTGLPSWDATHKGDVTQAGNDTSGQNTGVELAGYTVASDAANTGSGGNNTDAGGNNTDTVTALPPYLNMNFIIKI